MRSDEASQLAQVHLASLMYGSVLVAAELAVHPVRQFVFDHGHHRDEGQLELPYQDATAVAEGKGAVGLPLADAATGSRTWTRRACGVRTLYRPLDHRDARLREGTGRSRWEMGDDEDGGRRESACDPVSPRAQFRPR